MARATAFLPLVLVACAPPGEDGAWPVAFAGDQPEAPCPFLDGEHARWLMGGRGATTILISTKVGSACDSNSLLISHDDGRSFERVDYWWRAVDVTDDGTLLDVSSDGAGLARERSDGTRDSISPNGEGATTAGYGHGWYALATNTAVWRTRDGRDWHWWNRVPTPRERWLPDFNPPPIEIDEDGAVTLTERRWGEGDWIVTRTRGAPGATEMVALPTELGPPLDSSQVISGYGHKRAVLGTELFAVEGATLRRLDGTVPDGYREWAVDGAGRVLGTDGASLIRWSPQDGWRTIFSCPADRRSEE